MGATDQIVFDAPDKDFEAQVPERFSVCDEGSANWVARRIVEARAYARRVKEWAEQEQRRASREEEFFLRRFGSELTAWVRQELDVRGGKQKSINLPAGRVGFRTKQDRLVIDDEAAAIAWAKNHCPGAVNTVERCGKRHLDEHFEATGELPDGARLEPSHESFYVS